MTPENPNQTAWRGHRTNGQRERKRHRKCCFTAGEAASDALLSECEKVIGLAESLWSEGRGDNESMELYERIAALLARLKERTNGRI